MTREIILNGTAVRYELQYKKVKNINLRIKPDATVHVSANRSVPVSFIDSFVSSKADFILKAIDKCKSTSAEALKQYFTENEICDVISDLCRKVYPYYERLGIKYPEIKFRKMVSRWGSCRPSGGILSFNIYLMYAPVECIEYVVLHEFTHFLQANHSDKFYKELSAVCPDWKQRRQALKSVCLSNIH